jgi:hypothetical protein
MMIAVASTIRMVVIPEYFKKNIRSPKRNTRRSNWTGVACLKSFENINCLFSRMLFDDATS